MTGSMKRSGQRSSRALWGLLACLAAPALLPAQGETTRPQESDGAATRPAAADLEEVHEQVAAFRSALAEIVDLGRPAYRPLASARRRIQVAAVRPVLRKLGRRLRQMEDGEGSGEVDRLTVMVKVRRLVESTTGVVEAGQAALPPLEGAVEDAAGTEKDLLETLREQVYTGLALKAIAPYLEDGEAPGTFDGMFASMERLGEPAADAFLRIFLDLDQDEAVRLLAGEGVAQLGGERHQSPVRTVWEDSVEVRQLREKAKEVLARLGDSSLIDEDLAAIRGQLAQQQKELARARSELAGLQEKLEGAEDPSKLQEALQRARLELARATFDAGLSHYRLAFVHQGARDRAATEEAYRHALDHWLRIAPLLHREPRQRGMVAIAWYNLACVQSLQGKAEQALGSLEESFKWGYERYGWARTDGDLANVRQLAGFEKLIEKARSGDLEKPLGEEAPPQPPGAPEDAGGGEEEPDTRETGEGGS